MDSTTLVHCKACNNVHTNEACPQSKAATDFFSNLEKNINICELTDEQVADIVLSHLWAECPVHSTAASLLSSVIDRLKRAKGGPCHEG